MLRSSTMSISGLAKKLAVRSMSTASKPDYDKLGSIKWISLPTKYIAATVEDFKPPSKSSCKISIERLMGWVRATAPPKRREIFQYIDNNCIFIMENAGVATCAERLDFWEPPPKGWIKFNVDASFPLGEPCKPTYAFVQSCSQGLRKASYKSLPHVTSLEHAKLYACFEALTFARDEGIKKVIVETDCDDIVKKIRGIIPTGAEDDELTYGRIWDLMNCFDGFEIKSVPPAVNCGAKLFATSHV